MFFRTRVLGAKTWSSRCRKNDGKIDPLRFWLVAFKKADTDETFYAVVLPDATVVEPEDETKV